MNRWSEQAPELDPRAAAAGRLLARVSPPAPLSDMRRARIAEALHAPPRAARPWVRWGVVGVAAAVAMVVLVPRGERTHPPAAIATAPTAAPGSAPEPAPAPAPTPAPVATHAAPAAPSPRRTPPVVTHPRTVALRAGELDVDGQAVVETPRARIEVPAGGRAHVAVTADGVRVASIAHAVIVHWIASDARIEVAAGEIWSSELLAPPAADAPPPLGEEAQQFATILTARKTDPSGRETLQKLDEYGRRYPGGTFAREAQTIRVDALMRGGDRAAALAVLERMSLDELAQRVELLVLRGELRVHAERPREAVADFERAIAHATAASAIGERARYGRAAALAAAGERAAARAALADYLARFPGGRFAATARAALEQK